MCHWLVRVKLDCTVVGKGLTRPYHTLQNIPEEEAPLADSNFKTPVISDRRFAQPNPGHPMHNSSGLIPRPAQAFCCASDVQSHNKPPPLGRLGDEATILLC